MKVLNTYIENSMNPLGVLTFVLVIVAVIIWFLKDDITRFFERLTIGSDFYSYMKYVWVVLLVFSIIFASISGSRSINHKVLVEATIIDKYPIGALYSKYNIIEKRGEIWVLELRPSYEEEGVNDNGDGENND